MKTTDLLGPLTELEEKKAPEQLFCLGNQNLLQSGPRIAIIGSRQATYNGIHHANQIVQLFAEKSARHVIVSGLASGIDTVAHTAAIAQGLGTIAVIGTPLGSCYPSSNSELQHVISMKHLLISQFDKLRPVTKRNFILRNFTMALICDATIIVEAGEKSGTASMGAECLRLGRPLYIHQSTFEKGFPWCKSLVANGARVLYPETMDGMVDRLNELDP